MAGTLQVAWLGTLVLVAIVAIALGGWPGATLLVLAAGAGAAVWAVGRMHLQSPAGTLDDRAAGDADAAALDMISHLPLPAAILAGDRVRHANTAFIEGLLAEGIDRPIVDMSFTNLVHAEDRTAVLALGSLATALPEAAPITVRLLREDGTATSRDLTVTRLRAGAALLQLAPAPKASASALHGIDPAALMDHLEQAVFHTDTDGAFRFLSQGWERLTGFAPGDSIGQSVVSHLHPADRDDTRAALALLTTGRKDHLVAEARLLAGNGTLHWVELRARSVMSAGGEPDGAAGTFTEITRRKQQEESLRSSRRHLNTLLANVPGMVYRGRHDRNWTMEFVSDGCLDLTGYEAHDIVDSARIAFGDLIHPEDREFVWAMVDTQLAQAKSFQLSYRIVDVAGEVKWVWEQGRGVFSSSGELLALEGFITDVSARRGAEEQAKRRLWFDARTGLASRAIFEDRLAFVLDHGRLTGYRCAVLWVDIDNFGEINARFGRDFGDRVLTQMARRFKVVQGPGATVARVGGDEFAMLVTDFRVAGASEALPVGREVSQAVSRLAEHVTRALGELLRIEGRELSLSASIGIAVQQESHVSADALLQDARRAATAARAAGAGQWRLADD